MLIKHGYTPHVNLSFQVQHYEVRLAHSQSDLQKIFQLRHSIFYQEWLGESHPTGTDEDEFDQHADHLMITDLRTNQVVATYRILCSRWTKKFYSQSEFELTNFLKMPGTFVELGRACVKPEYRSGLGIDLLWRGIAQYLIRVKADRIFGCASVLTDSTALVQSLMDHLRRKDSWSDEFLVRPRKAYAHWPDDKLTTGPLPELELPPLLRGYLLAGAKVYGLPAFDEDFLCFDLFTKLEVQDINLSFLKRYFRSDVAQVSGL